MLTTHYLEEAEALATRVVVISEGRLLTEGTVDQIREKVGLTRVSYTGPAPSGWADNVTVDGDTVTIHTPDADALVKALVDRDIAFQDLQIRPASLEEAFVTLTR